MKRNLATKIMYICIIITMESFSQYIINQKKKVYKAIKTYLTGFQGVKLTPYFIFSSSSSVKSHKTTSSNIHKDQILRYYKQAAY